MKNTPQAAARAFFIVHARRPRRAVIVHALAVLCAAAPAIAAGDPARGQAIAENRQLGLCVLCHVLPGKPAVLHGDIGPPLAGVGARLLPVQLRERLLAPKRFNPQTVMPAFARREGLDRPAPRWAGRPLLDDAQIDDVVAWLSTLR